MKTFATSLLLVLLIGVASAFFRPAEPVQIENNAVAMNAELFGLDNPGKEEVAAIHSFVRLPSFCLCAPS